MKQIKGRHGVGSPLSPASDSNTLVGTQRSEISSRIGSAAANGLSNPCDASPTDQSNESIAVSVLGNKFYGPTSPDFGLNIAQLKMRKGDYPEPSLNSGHLASIDDHQNDDTGANNSVEP